MQTLVKKNNKKGFTLVEIIVVLVILAILAAIMIPSMTGWIDKAQQKSAIVEARTFLLAAQTVASEEYAAKKDYNIGTTEAELEKVTDLAGIGGDSAVTSCTVANGKVTAISITSTDGVKVNYDGTSFTIVP